MKETEIKGMNNCKITGKLEDFLEPDPDIKRTAVYFKGCTFFAHLSTAKSDHSRMTYIREGLKDPKGFFIWLEEIQDELTKTEKTACYLKNAQVIAPFKTFNLTQP